MVCVGRKAQALARRGMDIRRGNHPSRRRALSAVLTRVAYTSPSPGRRKVWTSSSQLRSFTCCRLFSTLQWLRNTQAVPLVRTGLVRTGRNSGCSADTSAPGSPPRWLCSPSPSPPSPLASPRRIPTHPGHSLPVPQHSRSVFSRSSRLFFQGVSLRLSRFLTGKPVGQCRQHLRLVSLDSHQVVPPGSPVRG